MTLEDGRASKAYDFVFEAKQILKPDEQKKYKSYVKKIPMLIKVNGLGPTMAFINSKIGESKREESAYNKIYVQIEQWLIYKKLINENLISEIIRKNSYEYRIITNEVIALLTWMKRFVESMIEGDEN
ncbi:type III-B CRISPR module-associated protein Cmr5 [Athalassotoga saccharophila]|uniref:type III-B CRISPR module-associated protein Cmr5 n=1 Tax=Athalassotoga saccharophila TaxID=1441386 RepID=UPI00137A19DB|nr:type III-B CRISPR module-associated protein Cmr5 [Athalassotoga saccharophila]